jgi:hypothetical protein
VTSPQDELFTQLVATHEVLKSARIPHGLIGGWAAIAWGRVRATRDIDWLAAVPVSRKKEVLALLSSFGEPEWREAGEDDPVAGLIRVVPTGTAGAVTDVLLARSGADRDALERCTSVDISGHKIPTVAPEDIVAMKLQAGGGLDYDDAQAILRVQAEKIDEALLAAVCRQRKVLDRLELIRKK